MENTQEKEEKIIDNIVKTVEKLDHHLDSIEQEEETSKSRFKEWFYEKEALHDIRHILREIDKYDGKHLKKLAPIDENFFEQTLDDQLASFTRDYFDI